MTGSFLSAFANIRCLGLTRIADDPETDGWKWIFIVQGALTIGIALLAWFLIIDFPEVEIKKNKFLSPEEETVVKARLLREWGSFEGEKVTWTTIKLVGRDWRIWSL